MPIKQNWGVQAADLLADLAAGIAVGLLLVGLVVTENYSGAVALLAGFLLGAKWRLMQ